MGLLKNLAVILLFSVQAQATLAPRMHSIMAQMNGSISQSSDINGGATYNNKLSLEVLYLVRNGPTFGGRYMIESRNENESQSGQAYGPMAGYYADNGFFVLFNYDVLAKLGRWTNGEGFEAGAGYVEHIGNQLHVGAKYSIRKIRYKTDITDNTAVQKNVSDSYPSITLMYLF
ncbi:hypothetical protein K2P97_12540 [bacterium]|nr:hypothetical protein [bacterium]